ncbi:uncharacterized protein BP5553_05047 [Venustampulla echinocandica]|uniref:Uncharacterized protein n=1 Tax=Venustampulla echinocandica TaxID=2656787 RepID=A0A370TQ09_9HELO|nr:uncharacterized protein BP5553_05047 [Venustampulla echinocandica]RDL37614.1 hypothetical protein BP5553_05047 [Venustampulla echinocandica]
MGKAYSIALETLVPGEYMPSPSQDVAPADAWGATAGDSDVPGGGAVYHVTFMTKADGCHSQGLFSFLIRLSYVKMLSILAITWLWHWWLWDRLLHLLDDVAKV